MRRTTVLTSPRTWTVATIAMAARRRTPRGPAPGRARAPAAPAAGDRDGDGVVDAKDQCPDDPEDVDSFQDTDGCPDPDNDQDGIRDVDDRCPSDPEDKDGFEDADGCPDPDRPKP